MINYEYNEDICNYEMGLVVKTSPVHKFTI